MPGDNGSELANRGSMLHICCEKLERDNLEFDDLLSMNIDYKGYALTEELLKTKVVPAMEKLDELAERYHFKSIVPEETIEFDYLTGGTIDIVGEGTKTLVIGDYKFGEGVMVYAFENDQLLFYAWIKLDQGNFTQPIEDFEKVALAIIQPADRKSEEKWLDVWETDVETIMDFGERFQDAVDIAEETKPGENLNDGEWCQFCPCAARCPARGRKGRAALKLIDTKQLGKEAEEGAVVSFTPMDLGKALQLADELEPWIKDVRKFAFAQKELGADVPGWKLVPKRATKRWRDPIDAARYLKRRLTSSVAMDSTVISPARAIAAGKKAGVKLRLNEMIISESSGAKLVRDTDEREALPSQKDVADTLKLIEDK